MQPHRLWFPWLSTGVAASRGLRKGWRRLLGSPRLRDTEAMTYTNSGNEGAVPPVVPFRPLTLGDLFSGMFAAVKARAGSMFAVALSVSLALGIAGAVVSSATSAYSGEFDSLKEWPQTSSDFAALLALEGADMVVSTVSAVALLIVAGLLTLFVVSAVVGVYLNTRQSWDALRPNVWRLLGAALLLWLIYAAVTVIAIAMGAAVVAVPILLNDSLSWVWILLLIIGALAVLIAAVWLSVRLYFVTQVVVVEGAGPGAAIGRSWQLTRNSFWRVLGRALLIGLVAGAVVLLGVGIIAAALGLGVAFAGWATGLVTFFATMIAILASGAVLPYTASYEALMYVDERVRQENLGPELFRAWEANRRAD